jgi:hypothetical protein
MIVAFSTGLDSFANPGEIGPMYPFADYEWLFVLISVALWLLWHVGQIRSETRENEDSRRAVEELGLERVMYYGGSALVPTDQEWSEAARHGYPGAQAGATAPVSPTGATVGEPPPSGPGPSVGPNE